MSSAVFISIDEHVISIPLFRIQEPQGYPQYRKTFLFYISRVAPDSPFNIVYGPSAEDVTLQAVEGTAPIVGTVLDNKVVWILHGPGHVEMVVLCAGLNYKSIQVINGTD